MPTTLRPAGDTPPPTVQAAASAARADPATTADAASARTITAYGFARVSIFPSANWLPMIIVGLPCAKAAHTGRLAATRERNAFSPPRSA